MFEIGQKVVCIKTHSEGVVKEGEVYTVQGMKVSKCCGCLDIDVGIKTDIQYTLCACGGVEDANSIHWLHSTLFRPLDDLFNEEIEELMNEIEELCPA